MTKNKHRRIEGNFGNKLAASPCVLRFNQINSFFPFFVELSGDKEEMFMGHVWRIDQPKR